MQIKSSYFFSHQISKVFFKNDGKSPLIQYHIKMRGYKYTHSLREGGKENQA